MDEFKGTPGPWTFDGENPLNQGFDVALSDGGTLATAYYCEDGEGRDEAEANARLISYAPDLLAALERLVSAPGYSDSTENYAASQHARAVIAKATWKGVG